jgi:hypothetical protein
VWHYLPHTLGAYNAFSAPIAAVRVALLDLGLGLGPPVLPKRAAYVVLRLRELTVVELTVVIAPSVALVVLVRLDQLAISCHGFLLAE